MLHHLVCPISHSLPMDPVMAADGHLYEREHIETHLATRDKSPVTNLKMSTELREVLFVTNMLQTLVDQGTVDPLLDEWVEVTKHANRREVDDGCVCTFKKNRLFKRETPNGVVDYYENGDNVKTEFAPTHVLYGQMFVWEDGEHLMTEFLSSHPEHGRVNYIENGRVVQTVFRPTHSRHGEILSFDEDELVRVEFGPTHSRHGEIDYFNEGVHTRTEYSPFHSGDDRRHAGRVTIHLTGVTRS